MRGHYRTGIMDDWGRVAGSHPGRDRGGRGLRVVRDRDPPGPRHRRGDAIISSARALTPAAAAHATALLNAAGALNPDREVDLLRSQLALRQGDLALARRLALSVARREPLNAEAWLALGQAAGGNRATQLLAFAHVYQLAPPIKSRG